MANYREILRLHSLGSSQRSIAREVFRVPEILLLM